LPGDELVVGPVLSLTHAVTIAAAPADVWPWLTQMGAGRAGWYSYDWLDNGGVGSARELVGSLVHVEVGDVMLALPGATDAFVVVRVDEPRYLVLGVPDAGAYRASWAWVLVSTGTATRLLSRARLGQAHMTLPVVGTFDLPDWLARVVGVPVHALMQRRQLCGVRERAERSRRGPGR